MLQPVMFVPRVTDVHHGLSVCGGVVRVPLEEEVVLRGRQGWGDTVRPLTGVWDLRQGPGLISQAAHSQVFVETPVTPLKLLPWSGTLKAARKYSVDFCLLF